MFDSYTCRQADKPLGWQKLGPKIQASLLRERLLREKIKKMRTSSIDPMKSSS
jgi:hypothetical protein